MGKGLRKLGGKGGNKGIGVDFKRVKNKVGKKLPKAKNETDTTIKAGSIHLPTQAALEDKSGAATSRRNLTMHELLSQLGHHSDKTRRDAITGLDELIAAHPSELSLHLAASMERLSERMTDTDKEVRKALASLIRSRLLPLLEAATLRPFLPLIMAHVCRAMTHLSSDVRTDSLGFLEALLEVAAAEVLGGGGGGYLSQCLEHFCDMFSQRATGSSGGRSLKALHRALSGLETFLSHAERALGGTGASTSAGNGGTARAAAQATPAAPASLSHEYGSVLRAALGPLGFPARVDMTRALERSRAAAAAPHGVTVSGDSSASAQPATGPLHSFCRLVPILLEAWQECSPGSLADTPDPLASHAAMGAASCLRRVLSVTAALGGTGPVGSSGASPHVLRVVPPTGPSMDGSDKGGAQGKDARRRPSGPLPPTIADALCQKLCLFFPLGMPSVKPTKEVADALIGTNLEAAKALAACVPGAAPGSPWIRRLALFYLDIIESGTVLPSSDAVREAAKEFPAPHSAYEVALGGCLDVLPGLPDVQERARVLEAVADLATRSAPRSQERLMCARLWLRVLGDPAGYVGSGLVPEASLCGWLSAAPRLLYELAGKRPEASEVVLKSLHAAATLAPPTSDVAKVLAGLQPQFAALFLAAPPAEGARVVIGPVAKLPTSCQRLAADILLCLGSPSDSLLRTAAHIALHPSAAAAYGTETSGRVLDAILAAAAPPATEPDRLLGFIATLIRGGSGGAASSAGDAVSDMTPVDRACRAMLRWGGPHALTTCLAAMEPTLLSSPPLKGAATAVRWRRGLLYVACFAVGVLGSSAALPKGLAEALPRLCAEELLSSGSATSLVKELCTSLGPDFFASAVQQVVEQASGDLAGTLPSLAAAIGTLSDMASAAAVSPGATQDVSGYGVVAAAGQRVLDSTACTAALRRLAQRAAGWGEAAAEWRSEGDRAATRQAAAALTALLDLVGSA